MQKNVKIGGVIIAIIIAGVLVWQLSSPQAGEFRINATTFPLTPADLAFPGVMVEVEIAVRDTQDNPDTQPWAMCGVIAGPPSDSSTELFPHDSFGFLDPPAYDIALIQDETNESILFPNGGTTGLTKTFDCDAVGNDDIYIHYITSRLVRDCSPDSLQIMQNDPEAEKKIVSLGRVRCIDPNNPPPPEEAGLERSEGTSPEIPSGFEYVGPQTIEIGADGEFIDRGYLQQGQPPVN